jgi:archaetidylinositol phosphate synthase
MIKANFFQAWSKLHGDAQISGIVKGWLTISYYLVRPLAKLRVTPNMLSIAGLIFGIALYLNAQNPWAIGLLVASLLCDGIDGSLAIITNKASKWGAALDSILDRTTEVFWVLTFISIGGNEYIVIGAAILAFAQEYLRARAGGLGLTEVGVVTIAERPVRASILFVSLIAFTIDLQIINFLAALWLILQSFSFLTISRFAYKRLG